MISEELSRKVVKQAIAILLKDKGFDKVQPKCLELLIEIFICYTLELARSSKFYAELSGRTDVLVTDIVMAKIELGTDVSKFLKFFQEFQKFPRIKLTYANPMTDLKRLKIGNQNGPQAPNYFPSYPEPHTYIRTLTHKKPLTDYQVLREKCSFQKKSIETALTKFMAKIGDTENLFSDDPYAYPLIANKLKPIPYLEALLPKEDEYIRNENEEKEENSENKNKNEHESDQFSHDIDADQPIDNPYLKPITMPMSKTVSHRSK